MNGFAFAAIYKEPDTPGPGPHIDGPVIDDEDEKEKDNTTYTISGTSITPFVPFTVTVTASNDKGKGNGGHLQSSFNYEVIDDGGEWKSGTTHTWNLFTRVCDKNIQTVQFAWLISGREPVRATLNYNCGSMTPAISGAVIIGKTFNFSITFSGHGESCLARSLSDFGATYWWETRKNNTWERTNRIAVNQTPSFSQGVLSGVAHVGNLVGYDRIRLCVSYAGLATAYAEAAITSAAVTITLGDDSLHVWGPETTLQIESESLQYMTAEFKRGGNATQDITDTNGDPITFTFSGQTWTGDIQAATSAAEGTVKLVVKYGNEIVKEQEIGIVTEFLPTISANPQSIIQGDSFDMTGSIASTLGLLSRVPANGFKLVAVQNGTTLAEVNNSAGSQEVEYEGVTPSTSDTVYVRIIDNRDDTIVEEITVAVQSVYEALAEAINERMAVKHVGILVDGSYNETNYTGIEGATYLAQYAKTAMLEYAKIDWNEANGSYTRYADNNTDISLTKPEAMTEAQWMKDCYNKVCSAQILIGNTTGWSIDGICVFKSETKQGRGEETDSSKSQSEVVNAAKSKANTNYEVSSTGTSHDITARTYVGKYEYYHCLCAKEYTRTKAYCNYSFPTANTIKIFFLPNSLYTVFDDFGGNLTIDSCPCLVTFSQAANQHGSDSDNNWAEGPAPFFRDADNGDTSVARGYRMSLKGMNISFNFKHQ